MDDFDMYQKKAVRTRGDVERYGCSLTGKADRAHRPGTHFGLAHLRLLQDALGACGEVGELADHIKKWSAQGHELDVDKIKEEAGDALWYLASILDLVGVDMSEAARFNLEKLARRYPEGHFTVERSVNRSE